MAAKLEKLRHRVDKKADQLEVSKRVRVRVRVRVRFRVRVRGPVCAKANWVRVKGVKANSSPSPHTNPIMIISRREELKVLCKKKKEV